MPTRSQLKEGDRYTKGGGSITLVKRGGTSSRPVWTIQWGKDPGAVAVLHEDQVLVTLQAAKKA